jgi:hypothetical protein
MSPMDQPERSPSARLAATIGMYGSALGVFTCGWLAMRSDDWRVIVGLTAMAGVAGIAAQAFSKRTR